MSGAKNYQQYRPHPWHGLATGAEAPTRVNAYIEITPFDYVKYEVDKHSGYLKVDRPQQGSSQPPTLYGFIPRTYCAEQVQELSPGSKCGDKDPLDICVISERPISRSEIIVECRVIGGIQMIDNDEADDKILAVLESDDIFGSCTSVTEIPDAIISRLKHYFSTYKSASKNPNVRIEQVYDAEHAKNVVKASIIDYVNHIERHTLNL